MFANKFGEHENVYCGLVTIIAPSEQWLPPTKIPIPLISVDVNASVVHAVAQVEVTQVYVNKEDKPIEAIYYFPTNPDGAVTHFQAELEGQIIKGIVKENEEAEATYNEAVANNTTAFLGEETKADIFKIRVGFLKPGSQVKVTIGYVTEVKNEPGSNAIRFYIPTTSSPRYVSPTETGTKVEDIKDMQFSDSSAAPLSIKVAVSLQGGIKSITSPTHQVKVAKIQTIPEHEIWHKAIVELSGNTTDMDRDFVLEILPEEIYKPRLYSEKTEDGSTALMVHLIPSFKLDEQKSELIFVLDRSGSMSGQSILLAKKALLIFLHSMPVDCYFNVIGFGSTFKTLFNASVKYDDKTLRSAVKHAKTLKADLGGTEIFSPLKHIYDSTNIKGYLRQIFVITDGEVSNTEPVIGMAKANAHKARLFALGIGDGASLYLVEGMAKAGGGTGAFVTYQESIDKKVLNQLKNALQPALTDVELEWDSQENSTKKEEKSEPVLNKEKTLLGYNKPLHPESEEEYPSTPEFLQSPKLIPPIFDGSQLLAFGLFPDQVPNAVTIKAQSPDGPLTLKIEHSPQNNVGSTVMLHKLAAIKLIRELELEEAASTYRVPEGHIKKQIVSIGCQNGITSKYTSFIAVDVAADKPCPESWVMESRHIPSQFANGWAGNSFLLRLQTDQCVDIMRQNVEKVLMRDAKLSELCDHSVGNQAQFRKTKSIAKTYSRVGLLSSLGRVVGNLFPKRQYSSETPALARFSSNFSFSSEPVFRKSSTEDDEMFSQDKNDAFMVQLISLQSFDGAFKLDETLAKIMQLSLKSLKEETEKQKLTEAVFATALVISFFTTMPDQKDVWELVVLKARKWLAKNVDAEKVDEILRATEVLISKK